MDNITVHLTISAAGKVLPTSGIFEKSLPCRGFTNEVPDDWWYGVSPSGNNCLKYLSGQIVKPYLYMCSIINTVLHLRIHGQEAVYTVVWRCVCGKLWCP